MITKFSNKDPVETILLTYDFSNMLDTTELLTTSTWSIDTVKGIDLTPELMLTGAISIDRKLTSGYISGGILGNTYNIHVIVTTTKNQTLKMTGSIDIKVQ